jgi:hypothetical protein
MVAEINESQFVAMLASFGDPPTDGNCLCNVARTDFAAHVRPHRSLSF